MPATEQTWRDTKQLHRIFMVSGVALLLATIWMFYADHNRQWKQYQDTTRTVDLAVNKWTELQHKTDAKLAEHELLQEAIKKEQASGFEDSILAQFIATLAEETQERAEIQTSSAKLQTIAVELAAKPTESEADKQAQQQLMRSAIAQRAAVTELIEGVLAQSKFDEAKILDARKKTSARLDAARANLDIGVRDSLPEATMEGLKSKVNAIKEDLDNKNREYQKLADLRKLQERLYKQLLAKESEAKRAAEANRAELASLGTAYTERQMTYFTDTFPYLGKKWLAWPILDAFNSPRKIDNMWNDGLTIDYNFRDVRRFDRCTTCHQSMEKSQPGQADKPAFVKEKLLTFQMATPVTRPTNPAESLSEDERRKSLQDLLQETYGFRIAWEGLLNPNDAVVTLVLPQSSAAKAEAEVPADHLIARTGLELRSTLLNASFDEHTSPEIDPFPNRPGLTLGDVIVRINDDVVRNPDEAYRILLRSVQFGKPVNVVVRRGLPSPYTSHPRLDLFVGSLSPHKAATFACTICHEGQGSATAFEWASHTPNSSMQRKQWLNDHGWFDNHHWIYPMYAKRLAESTCLKCHHDVVELEPSERFPEAPAPKLTHGYHVIRKFGCYGCHEVTGFDGPTRRVGPDMRLEPNFFAAAQEIRARLRSTKTADGTEYDRLNLSEKEWLDQLIAHPEKDNVRHRLYEVISIDEKRDKAQRRFSSEIHKLASVLKDIEAPGDLRKPGPSLRYAASKLDDQFLFDWIRTPKHFRPDSRMPQFFGLWDHLEAEPASKATAQKYEPLEILGIATYLKSRSQPFENLQRETNLSPPKNEDQIARGKIAFQERGCLACHNHKDFPGTKSHRQPNEIVQGPDLTGIGTKFNEQRNPAGKDWLYSWIKQPSRYHARTVMPDLFLEVVTRKVLKPGVQQPKRDDDYDYFRTDPVADIVAYLMSSANEWQPAPGTLTNLDEASRKVLDEMVVENLKESFSESTAAKFGDSGIPAEMERELKGAEKELIAKGQELSATQKLLYIGSKSVNKYGCFGCHDIPGFEDAKPIGTALADWGRKDSAKLAFEHIAHYLHGHGSHHDAKGEHGEKHHDHGNAKPTMPDFYQDQLNAGNRIGFIWQKLAEPRSYDFKKTENKKYNDRLRMPQFPFSEAEREAVITFVLGLVADPPESKFVYHPDARAAAIIAGRKSLDKFNCAGCHMLEAEQWKVNFASGTFGEQPATKSFPFAVPHHSSDALSASTKADHRGLLHATLRGMPALRDADGLPSINDIEGDPIEDGGSYLPTTLSYAFDLWKPVAIEGKPFQVGVVPLNIAAPRIEDRHASRGGMLAKYLVPEVTKREKLNNPAAKGSEAWAWVPPPLVGEGTKVQSAWLHDFLLNPHVIRPATVLRMPRFNMTSQEATDLVKYFSAIDNAEYPYEYASRRQAQHLLQADETYKKNGGVDRFQDAMKIVTNSNYCTKCHLVGDFEPKGADRAKAPNLARIYERMRPEYLREWIANPKQILPYTSMPVNVPYDPADTKTFGGVSQDLYHGTSVEQVDALVDLLMNFDNYAKKRSLISPLVKQDPPPGPAAQPNQTDASSDGK